MSSPTSCLVRVECEPQACRATTSTAMTARTHAHWLRQRPTSKATLRRSRHFIITIEDPAWDAALEQALHRVHPTITTTGLLTRGLPGPHGSGRPRRARPVAPLSSVRFCALCTRSSVFRVKVKVSLLRRAPPSSPSAPGRGGPAGRSRVVYLDVHERGVGVHRTSERAGAWIAKDLAPVSAPLIRKVRPDDIEEVTEGDEARPGGAPNQPRGPARQVRRGGRSGRSCVAPRDPGGRRPRRRGDSAGGRRV